MLLVEDFLTQSNQYTNLLRSMAYKFTRNDADSEDLIQDTLHRAIKNLDKFKPGTNLKAWLSTIMRNIFINNYRKSKKRRELVYQTDVVSDQNLLNVSIAQNNYDFSLISETIEKVMDNLKDDLKEPFLLHHEGYKYEEIAEQLDIPLGTVKSRIFLARQNLVQQLKDYGITNSSLN